MLLPKRVKHRKLPRGRMKGRATRGNQWHFGEFGLQAPDCAWPTHRPIETARIALHRHLKRGGNVWTTACPDKSYTKKPAETRMGSGKGTPEGWVAVVRPGRVLFELSGVDLPTAREALRLAAAKLPIRVKTLQREGVGEAVEV